MANTFEIDLKRAMSSNKVYQAEVRAIVKEQFEERKAELIENFQDHPVTQEISNPNSSNISNTLGGYGNLYDNLLEYSKKKSIISERYLLDMLNIKNIYRTKLDYLEKIIRSFCLTEKTILIILSIIFIMPCRKIRTATKKRYSVRSFTYNH